MFQPFPWGKKNDKQVQPFFFLLMNDLNLSQLQP